MLRLTLRAHNASKTQLCVRGATNERRTEGKKPPPTPRDRLFDSQFHLFKSETASAVLLSQGTDRSLFTAQPKSPPSFSAPPLPTPTVRVRARKGEAQRGGPTPPPADGPSAHTQHKEIPGAKAKELQRRSLRAVCPPEETFPDVTPAHGRSPPLSQHRTESPT